MKILKNIFGSKPKQNPKYEPNTLAEMNESPDLRLATAKEKEVDIPLPKSEEVYKIPNPSSRSTAKSTKSTAKQTSNITKSAAASNSTKVKKETEDIEKKSTKSSKSDASTKAKSTSKSTSKATNSTKDTSASKTSEAKKSTSKSAKNESIKQKSEAKTEAENAAKKPVSTTKAKAQTDVKAATTAKKSSSTTAKNTSLDAKKSDVKGDSKTNSSKKTTDKTPKSTDKSTTSASESKSPKTGKFEIKKSKDGRFVFNLYASNSVIVATSQVYSSSSSAMNGIKSVIANASTAPIEDQTLKNVVTVPFPKWEIYLDKGEEYRFRLCASNGSCVCHSQGYTSKANCKKGIESIIKFAGDAEITKVYLDKDK